ncbi:hypothetical protein BOTBODRAFT_447796 [Botryobasidium botryosum FD-172 SS1]|uniref:Uncharacterized protein n=1 Tax=Botryobasidium botryosum (strain FD-172 SS1) TaxID=930990 RepID=A0A067M7U8_BOTB1|nr:hypothetical protein BOTBODRAFT_447796 [Botryobasidium botryosum FD-172 SS1]
MSATDTSKKPRKSVAWAEPLETIIPFEREEWEWEQSFGRDKSSCGIRSVRRLRRFELDFEEETASDEENEEPTSELHAAYSSRYSRKAVSFEDFEDPMDFFNAMLGHEALYEPAASANQLRKEFAKKTISPAPIHAESAFDGPCTVSLPADSDQTARALTLTDSDGANESGSIGDSEPHPQEDVSLGTLQDEQNGSAALAAHESCRLDVGAEIGVNPEPILGVRVEIHLSEELEDALAHFPRASCEGRLIDIDILEAISDMLYSVPLVQETERIAVEGTCQLCLAQEIERAVVEETCEVCLAQEVAEPTAPAAEEVREMCPVKQLESSSLSTPASPPMPLALVRHLVCQLLSAAETWVLTHSLF